MSEWIAAYLLSIALGVYLGLAVLQLIRFLLVGS